MPISACIATIDTPTTGPTYSRACFSFFTDAINRAEHLMKNPVDSFWYAEGLQMLTAVRPAYAKFLKRRIELQQYVLTKPECINDDGVSFHVVAREIIRVAENELQRLVRPKAALVDS